MSGWRYIAARLQGDGTEKLLHPDLQLRDVSFTDVLTGASAFSATISPADPSLMVPAIDGLPLLEEWSTAIFLEEDDVIRGGVILTSSTRTGPVLELSGLGFTGIIKNQPYSGTGKFFVKTDPIDIARYIWDAWQGLPGGNIGMTMDRTTKAGVLIGTVLKQAEFDTQAGPVSFESGPVKLNDYETNDLGGMIDQFAADYGFDYHESHAWNAAGTGFTHKLDFGVPRIGTRRTDLRFTVGVNVFTPPSETTEADAYYSAVLTRGAGDGASMKRKLIPRAGERRLRRVLVVEDNKLKTDAAVAARGNAILPLVTGRADISELTIKDHPDAPFGTWVVGDEIEVFTESEWGTGSTWVRIVSNQVKPQDPNVVSVSVVRADKIAA